MNYQVILDYVNVDVSRIFIYVKRVLESDTSIIVPLFDGDFEEDTRYIIKDAPRYEEGDYDSGRIAYNSGDLQLVALPIYIGVGLRMTATFQVNKGNISISGLGAIGAEVRAGNLSGTSLVQTLAITGKSIANSLPLPNEINQNTIQNALISIGPIKATLYDTLSTIIEPRVVGFYDPIGGGTELANAVISFLSIKRAIWYRPCQLVKNADQ